MRNTQEIFESHLKLRDKKELEKDINENYSPAIFIISNHGNFYGHDGVRESAGVLNSLLPNAIFKYELKEVNGEVAYLVWDGRSKNKRVRGTDTFLIRDGKIIIQTIFYEEV
jgi:hypothetical protein